MKVIVDDKIPYIKGQIERLADEVVYLAGAKISHEDVKDADAMIIRTRTHCNKELLEGSKVRFIATATIGFDHLDTRYLDEAGIVWTNCPGCNATSVAQYVHSCLLLLQKEHGMNLKECTLGIIGVGNVGTRVLEKCEPLVNKVLLNDPPRQAREGERGNLSFSPLTALMEQCDIITIHTPLVMDGPHPSYHIVDDVFLHQLPKRPVIINCGRGEVVDNIALEEALDEGRIRQAIIDTWENEPNIRLSLLNKVYIGTPHIAGYSADGKANATRMSLQALARWMGREISFDEVQAPPLPAGTITATSPEEIALQLYNPMNDSDKLKHNPEGFELQRGGYPLRREVHFEA